MKRLHLLACGLTLGACALLNAHASSTVVNTQGGGDGSERCLEGHRCSGGTYNNALSLITVFEQDLGFAPGSFIRVDDDLDKIWQNFVSSQGGGQVQAVARYASDSSRLGFDAGAGFVALTSAGTNNKVLVSSAAAFAGEPAVASLTDDFVIAPDSWVTIPLPNGAQFAFVLHDISMGYKITSNPLSGVGSSGYANSGLNLDYMVTYKVPDAVPHYFIAWEDRNPKLKHLGDYDYNDLIVEVKFTSPVPEPQAYVLMLAGILMLGMIVRRRRSKV